MQTWKSLFCVVTLALFSFTLYPQEPAPTHQQITHQTDLVIQELVCALEKVNRAVLYWQKKTLQPSTPPNAHFALMAMESLQDELGGHLGALLLAKQAYSHTSSEKEIAHLLHGIHQALLQADGPQNLSELYHTNAAQLARIHNRVEEIIETYPIPTAWQQHWPTYCAATLASTAALYTIINYHKPIKTNSVQCAHFLKDFAYNPLKRMTQWIAKDEPLANKKQLEYKGEALQSNVEAYTREYHWNHPRFNQMTEQEKVKAINKIGQQHVSGDDRSLFMQDFNEHSSHIGWNLAMPKLLGGGYVGHIGMLMIQSYEYEVTKYLVEADQLRNAVKWVFGIGSLCLTSIFGYFTVKTGQSMYNYYHLYITREPKNMIHAMYMLLNQYRCPDQESPQAYGLIYFYAQQLEKMLHKLPGHEQAQFKQDLAQIALPSCKLQEKRAIIKHWYRHYSFLETPKSAFLY